MLHAVGKVNEAASHLEAARSKIEALLDKHLLAFADHGAEFYIGSGGDPLRALELAQINLSNRPTLRAFEQTYAIALEAGETDAANEISARATKRWGNALAFRFSPFVQDLWKPGKEPSHDQSIVEFSSPAQPLLPSHPLFGYCRLKLPYRNWSGPNNLCS